MKKFLKIVLTLGLVLTLFTACSQKPAEQAPATQDFSPF